MNSRWDPVLSLGCLYGLWDIDNFNVVLNHISYRLWSPRALALPDDVLDYCFFRMSVTRVGRKNCTLSHLFTEKFKVSLRNLQKFRSLRLSHWRFYSWPLVWLAQIMSITSMRLLCYLSVWHSQFVLLWSYGIAITVRRLTEVWVMLEWICKLITLGLIKGGRERWRQKWLLEWCWCRLLLLSGLPVHGHA